MVTRILPIARIIRPATCASSAQFKIQTVRHGHGLPYDADRKIAIKNRTTFDDLPVPSGSFEEISAKKNRNWNFQLVCSILFFAGATYFLKVNGGFDPYYYWWKYSSKPPVKPTFNEASK